MLAGPIILFIALAAILIPKLPGYMGGGGGTANFLLITMHFFMKRPPISKYHSLKMFLKQSRKSIKQVGFYSIGNPGYRLFYRPCAMPFCQFSWLASETFSGINLNKANWYQVSHVRTYRYQFTNWVYHQLLCRVYKFQLCLISLPSLSTRSGIFSQKRRQLIQIWELASKRDTTITS